MTHQIPSVRLSGHTRSTHELLVRLGYRRSLLTIVAACTIAAMLLVGGLMAAFEVIESERGKGMLIAALVPVPIAWFLAHITLSVVFELERMRIALNESARRDTLTQVFNRGHLLECLSAAFDAARDSARPLSMLMIDIDHFKAINDQYGHPTGDRVLQALALSCWDALEEEDVLARFGGEEFVVLVPDLAAPAAFELAERVRRRICELRVPLDSGHTVTITASIGVGTTLPEDDHWERLIARADAALYHAKRDGRNRCSSSHTWIGTAASGTA